MTTTTNDRTYETYSTGVGISPTGSMEFTQNPNVIVGDWHFESGSSSAFTREWDFKVAINPRHGFSAQQVAELVDGLNRLAEATKSVIRSSVEMEVPVRVQVRNLAEHQAGMLPALMADFMRVLRMHTDDGSLRHMKKVASTDWPF